MVSQISRTYDFDRKFMEKRCGLSASLYSTFDKSAEKIDGRVLLRFLAPMLRFAISSSGSNFYSETLHKNLPVAWAKQLD